MAPRRGETIEEYRKRMRDRYATDPEYRERRRGPLRERRRERYAVDPECRGWAVVGGERTTVSIHAPSLCGAMTGHDTG